MYVKRELFPFFGLLLLGPIKQSHGKRRKVVGIVHHLLMLVVVVVAIPPRPSELP